MDTSPELITLTGGPAIAIRAIVPLAELPRFFGGAFAELAACARDQIAGPPLARYHGFQPEAVDVEAVFPLRAPVPITGRVAAITLAAGTAVQVRHTGPYDELGATYTAIGSWIVAHHLERSEPVREIYLNSPAETQDVSRLETLVVQPVRPSA
jgi:effector-binding domain-containing protein